MLASVKRLEIDAAGLKAMAHPLRVQILRLLELHRRASVTSLAEELGESTAAISYHLRQLARHGFVEDFEPDDLASGKPSPGRKQRWWRMAVDQIHMTGFEFFEDEDTREAAGFVTRELQSDRNRRMTHWVATATRWPAEWQRASSDLEAHLDLSPRQTRALADELAAVVDRYRTLRPGKGAQRVEVQYAVFPGDTGSIPAREP
jgi:DNA-binding transcriptional ArsR family regulator